MQINVIPVGTGGTGVGGFVADIQRFLRDRGVEHELGDMGTVLQGSVEELFSLATEIHNLPFTRGVQRVVTQITIDDRRDIERKLGEKRESVINRLKRGNDL